MQNLGMSLTRRRFIGATAGATAALVTPAIAGEPLARLRSLIDGMQAGEWLELPATQIGEILSKRADAPQDGAVSGPAATFYAWSGAAYDPGAHRWYFTGGGHTDYSGNEVYAFDFNTLRWERLTKPSPVIITGDPSQPANYRVGEDAPFAAHSYDGFVFCPLTRTIFMWLGSVYPSGHMSNDLWEFDPNRRHWRLILKRPETMQPGPPSAKWSPKHRKFLLFTVGTPRWFDPVTKTYSQPGGYCGYTDAIIGTLDDEADIYYFLQDNIFKVDLSKTPLPMAEPLIPGRAGSRPPNIDVILNFNFGFVWDPKRRHITFWDGGAGLRSWDPKTGKFAEFATVGAAPAPANQHVYSKWIYISDLDIYAGYDNLDQGVWIWKPAAQPGQMLVGDLNGVVVSNADGSDEKSFNTLSAAAAALKDGQRIRIKAGDHLDGGVITANGIHISGEAGAHIRNRVQDGGTGILVIKGNDCVVENLEISGGTGYGDTCGIRFMGRNLILRHCHLHHNNMNFLSAGDNGNILMEDCLFADTVHQEQYSHNIYVGGNSKGVATSFILRRCRSLRANGFGHLVKSRAYQTTIENCTLAMYDAESSRCIDASDGGKVIVRHNVLEVGPKADNNDPIGIALEYNGDMEQNNPAFAIQKDGKWEPNPAHIHETLIVDNLIINDRQDYARNEGIVTLVHSRSPGDVLLKGNIFVTGHQNAELGNQDGGHGQIVDAGGNKMPRTREDVPLAAYPFLPSPPNGLD